MEKFSMIFFRIDYKFNRKFESTLDENSEFHANSMLENAILVNDLNLNYFINDFINNYFTKIANLLYPDRFKKIDGIHSYIVRYGDNYDRILVFM